MAIEKINLNNLDKSDWKTYRFDEIAQNISERVDPNDTDLEVYVGLEHLDSESLHITRHGSPDDVNGTKLRFYKGDIIFGRRRAYQRKAGIATWDGFCSAHALVLRANPDVIHPDLFPFFMHSDLFMNRAVDISVGSLSPTINWGTLKHQEFRLPPKDSHKELASLLLSGEENIKAKYSVLNRTEVASQALIEQYVPKDFDDYWVLGDVVKIRRGVTYKSSDYSDSEFGTPLLNLKSIEKGGGFNEDGVKYFLGNCKELHYVRDNDLIIACTDITRSGDVVGYPLNPAVYQGKEMIFTMDLSAIEITDFELKRDYLYYVLKSAWVHWFLYARAPGTTVLHLELDGLRKLKVPKFDVDKQSYIIDRLKAMDNLIDKQYSGIRSAQVLQKQIINKVL